MIVGSDVMVSVGSGVLDRFGVRAGLGVRVIFGVRVWLAVGFGGNHVALGAALGAAQPVNTRQITMQ